MRFVASLAIAGLVLSACGGGSPAPPPANSQPTATVATQATSSSSPASTTTRSPTPTPDEVDLVTYIEAIENLLQGTSYEGEALESPDVFLATGVLFCDELDAGLSRDDLVIKYIERLSAGPIESAADDDLVMAGAVLGTGLVTLCPHNLSARGLSG